MTDRTAALIGALTTRGLTIGVAESLTGGAVCAELIRPAGASSVVVGGIVAYATSLKARILQVDPELLAAEGAVHPLVAAQMAAGVRAAVAVDGVPSDIGVATTGVAGPSSQDGHEPGTVYIAIDGSHGSVVRALSLSGGRDAVRAATVLAVIDLLFERVIENGADGE
ncbi:CinA family protein [Paramicrobacterium agarici]|uniref:CinA family protein n=1 Tax=Paramicrobacterium agarici TaxID=630514 RepID=UPI001151D5C5|nr:nicotinamide-nucleotide amidohydrolase family protein [Microbacterium agarici]TQO24103.1 nicotinamide-nucleotide amidase [Microbacterium agarici]